MTPIEKQILKNQVTILLTQRANQQDFNVVNSVRERLTETRELLKPTKDKTGDKFKEDLMKGCGKENIRIDSNKHGYDCGSSYKGETIFCMDCEHKFAKGKKGEEK